MKTWLSAFLLLALTLSAHAQNEPNLILKNGRVYSDLDTTGTSGRVWSQAISIRNGNIQSIGDDKNVLKEAGPATKIVDLKGRVVLPGFNDAHVHFIQGGLQLSRVQLAGITSIAELQKRVKEYAEKNPNKEWIFGQGWDNTAFPKEVYPTKADLDAVVSNKPVMLYDADLHKAVVNTKAMEKLKISGDSNGVLHESAMFNARDAVDKPTKEEFKQAFLSAQEQALQAGVTSIQGNSFLGPVEADILRDIYEAKKLQLRVSFWGTLDGAKEFSELRKKYADIPEEWIRMDTVKGFLDGVISSRTAALDAPYSDMPSTRGEPFYTQDKLDELVLTANRLGMPVALHAIGDRAVAQALTAISHAKRQLFNSRIRNRVEHIELAANHIYPKFAPLNVVASVQPSHMMYDNEAQSYNAVRLGKDRVQHAFAWKNLVKARTHIAFGTDWPVMPLNPLVGLWGAINRQHFNGRPLGGWNPSQKLTIEQSIEAYTLGSAYATREEHVKGSLREGKYADMIIFEKDPFKVRGPEFLKIPVYMTIVAGKIAYDGSVATIAPAVGK